MGLFDLFRKKKVNMEQVVASFEECMGYAFADHLKEYREQAQKIFSMNKFSEEDVAKALVEKFYAPNLTTVPAPVEYAKEDEKFIVKAELSQCTREKAMEYAKAFVEAIVDASVSGDDACYAGLDYGNCGRTLIELEITRCSNNESWSLADITATAIRTDKDLEKVFQVFCNACRNLIDTDADLSGLSKEMEKLSEKEDIKLGAFCIGQRGADN